jgi:DNA-binding response OmpR family regulator
MGGKRTVMICDDEPDLLRMYSVALKKHYHVLTADSGRDCMEKYMAHTLKGKKIDILLLDYRLGDTTGCDVACKIRELDGTKTILLTAFELEREKVNELTVNNCIAGMIRKPVTMKTLLEKLQSVD